MGRNVSRSAGLGGKPPKPALTSASCRRLLSLLHDASDDDSRGDRATGVEECDLVPGRQIERRATFERACHALALVIDYIRNTANRDALVRLYHDIAVDSHTRRARFLALGSWLVTVKNSMPPPLSVV